MQSRQRSGSFIGCRPRAAEGAYSARNGSCRICAATFRATVPSIIPSHVVDGAAKIPSTKALHSLSHRWTSWWSKLAALVRCFSICHAPQQLRIMQRSPPPRALLSDALHAPVGPLTKASMNTKCIRKSAWKILQAPNQLPPSAPDRIGHRVRGERESLLTHRANVPVQLARCGDERPCALVLSRPRGFPPWP